MDFLLVRAMNEIRPDGIIKRLRSSGYEAYFVGGCVRDTLLERSIHDWDITTSALPEQILSCFEHCVPTGIKHGTVTVFYDRFEAEVTTFRTDGNYSDSRHPEQVTFVRSLAEDLARRDFTINAMAMDEDGSIIDLYGGTEDLRRKLIRCVGEPNLRFREDALRMLRALRFSAQLGFDIETETREAICMNAHLSEHLSAERVRDEMEKTLCSPNPQKLDDMAQMGLLARCNPSAESSCQWIGDLPAEASVRWAALCHTWPHMDLSVLRLSKKITQDAGVAGRVVMPETEYQWKCLIAEQGEERSLIVGEMFRCRDIVERILSSGDCLSLRQLAVTGADFPDLKGPALGEHLKRLLHHVLEHPQDNCKEVLINISQGTV